MIFDVLTPILRLTPPKDGGSSTSILIIDYLPFTNLGLLALSPCGLATYDMQTEMSSSPAGGLCLPAG